MQVSIVKLVLASILAPLSITSASAQSGTADIPFTFVVANKTMSAGTYTVEALSADNHVLVIRSADNMQTAIQYANRCESVAPQPESKLVFHQYGDTYFLSQVWTEGSDSGRELPESRRESEVARLASGARVVLLMKH